MIATIAFIIGTFLFFIGLIATITIWVEYGACLGLTAMLTTILLLAPVAVVGCHQQIRLASETLTGYIYSAEDSVWDSTIGHIRYSENAGEDTQPSFCVSKGDGQQIKDLAGSGKKVQVTVPSGSTWRWIGDCGFPATIEIMEEK